MSEKLEDQRELRYGGGHNSEDKEMLTVSRIILTFHRLLPGATEIRAKSKNENKKQETLFVNNKY